MNEIKNALIIAIIAFIVGGAIGGIIVGIGKNAEVSEIKNDLRAAAERNSEIANGLERSRERAAEIEAIAEQRHREIEELREEVQFHIKRARERDRLIAGLESRVKTLRGRVGNLAELAEEGSTIVGDLIDDANEGAD